jgi:hypothetical protein
MSLCGGAALRFKVLRLRQVEGLLGADPKSGEQRAVFDLAWPNGPQEDLSQPVAVLLHEDAATIKAASEAGFRAYTDVQSFKRYVRNEVVGDPNHA